MPIYQAVVLAIVQGLTEFLPISSTAHLILVPWFLGWRDPGLAFDIAVHGGTLTAVMVYFYRDWMDLFRALVGWGTLDEIRRNRRFLLLLIVATLPGATAGYAFKSLAETEFRHPFLIAAMLIAIALFMWQGDRRRDLNRELGEHFLYRRPSDRCGPGSGHCARSLTGGSHDHGGTVSSFSPRDCGSVFVPPLGPSDRRSRIEYQL